MENMNLSNDLSGMLSRLRDAHVGRVSHLITESGADESLLKLRQAAAELHRAINAACREGQTVVIHSRSDSHQAHKICTTGGLIGEVILLYSPLPNANDCNYRCVLTEANRIEVVA